MFFITHRATGAIAALAVAALGALSLAHTPVESCEFVPAPPAASTAALGAAPAALSAGVRSPT